MSWLRIRILTCLAGAALALTPPADAGVMLQAFYVDVPTPNVGSGNAQYSPTFWWDRLAGESNALARAGFTSIWLPPP